MFRSTKLRFILCIAILTVLFAGATIALTDSDVKYQGNKARVAVGKIKPKTDNCSYDLAAAVGEMLSTALANTERFIVLASQEEVEELIDEIELGESEYVEEGRGAQKGLMEGADILVTGAVTAFEPDAGGKGGGLGGLKKKAFGKVGVSTKSAEIRLDIKVIDIRTRRVIKAKNIEAKSTKWGADVAGGGWVEDVALAGAMGMYSNQPMEDAVRSALAQTVEMLTKEIPEEYYRYTGDGQYTTEYGKKSGSGSGTAAPASGAASGTEGGRAASGASAGAASADIAEDMTLYTKYDFVPGNKVIFYDDMKGEEEGEFPYRWDLDQGVFEVVRLGKDYWIMCTDAGSILPKIQKGPLPPKYTVELDIYENGPSKSGHYFHIDWMGDKGRNIGRLALQRSKNTSLTLKGETKATKDLPNSLTKGVHTMRIMATDRSVKCYIDNERVANVPKVEGFDPVGFRLHMDPWSDDDNPMLFRGFRFAEGGKSMREQLDETGKVVTHGILFDSDSHKIKGESIKTLKEIAQLLEDDPDLRLSIDGHTDSDGSDEHNQTLSQKRADSVRQFLISNYSIASDRLEAKGWGESKPMDTNESAEGKANNRRVELVKI